jgi:hypothetical protein
MPETRTPTVAPAIASPAAVAAIASRVAFATFVACAVVGATLAAPGAAWSAASRLELLNQSVRVSGQSSVTGFGLRVHLAGGNINPGFEVVPTAEYWRDKDKAPELGVNELMQKDWKFGADARYRFGDDAGWTPYAGAGLAVHIVSSRSNVTFPGQAPLVIEDSGRKLAPNIVVGVDMPHAGPLRNSVEIGYEFVSNLKQFKVNFGIGWVFGGDSSSESSEE